MAGIQGNLLSGVRSSAVPEPVNYRWKKPAGKFWLGAAALLRFREIWRNELRVFIYSFEGGKQWGQRPWKKYFTNGANCS